MEMGGNPDNNQLMVRAFYSIAHGIVNSNDL